MGTESTEVLVMEVVVRVGHADVKVRRTSTRAGDEYDLWVVDGDQGTKVTVRGYGPALLLAGQIGGPLNEAAMLRNMADAAAGRARALAWQERSGGC